MLWLIFIVGFTGGIYTHKYYIAGTGKFMPLLKWVRKKLKNG